MKQFKKSAALLLIALLALGTVACTRVDRPAGDTTSDTTVESTTDTAAEVDSTSDTDGEAQPGDETSDETLGETTDETSDETLGETTEETSADTTGETSAEGDGETETEAPEIKIITIAEALELCGEPGNLTTERYYIKGTIVSIDNPAYGAMTIKDETGTISVYGTYSSDGAISYGEMQEKPYKNDVVLLHCTLQNYNGTKEVKNARLISFEKVEIEVDESDYTDLSVAEARDAEVGAKIKLDGVVARITYANGHIPMGVYLVDQTQSIYVYDGDLAGRVQIGDTVTLLGTKAYWILDTEKNNADKFGYKGCCQLEDVTILKVEDTDADFDKSWIPVSTVKDILETPVTENITSTIFKVNALVEKRDGQGFVNYYFFDLDGKTGAYTYTQCNGSDFAWLDEFDGKICTVYLSALNAKSTASDCYFRFIPVAVMDEGFTFNTDNAPAHAVEYYGLPQFNTTYSGNPAAEMITNVSSELLGFENVALSYTSADASVISFDEVDGKVIFNCKKTGKTTVTVTGTFGDKTYSDTLEIEVTVNAEYDDMISILDAQYTPVGETVIIKGIVGPSVVNKSGFYLFDETGMIAVIVKNAAIFDEIEIGHEIVITGVRDCYKDADKTHAGQTCLTQVEVLANYYGEHDYPTDKFITDKTLADVYALNNNEDHTTEVYVVKATVNFVETAYYTTLNLSDGDTKLSLYCSGAGQYSFLKQFAGQEVTLEIAPCNWNNKNYYVGCVLAVRTEDGKVINALNFNS